MGILNSRKIISISMTAGALLLWLYSRNRKQEDNSVNYLNNSGGSSGQSREKNILSTHWLNINGLKYHSVMVHGQQASRKHFPISRTPVILVHGLGVSGSYFLPFAKELASKFKVYVPDLPGHGKSGKPDRPMDIKALAGALEQWMTQTGIERVILIGHSMGCQVAAEFAITHPEKVACMVMIGLTPDPHERSIAVHFIRLLRAAIHERLSIAWPVAKDYLRMNLRIIPELISMIEDPIRQKLEKLSVPCMLIRGEHDAIFPQYWFEEAILLSGSQHSVIIAGGAHAVQYSVPEKLVEIIYPFLSGQVATTDFQIGRRDKQHAAAVNNYLIKRHEWNNLRQI